jgi:hypothetical protein
MTLPVADRQLRNDEICLLDPLETVMFVSQTGGVRHC